MPSGERFERDAASYLARLGWRVVARNFRCKTGEIDIIAWDGPTLVFVEVKARASTSYGLAQEFVGRSKRMKIIRTAQYYAMLNRLDCPMRLDVVAFNAGVLEHIPNAFDGSGR